MIFGGLGGARMPNFFFLADIGFTQLLDARRASRGHTSGADDAKGN